MLCGVVGGVLDHQDQERMRKKMWAGSAGRGAEASLLCDGMFFRRLSSWLRAKAPLLVAVAYTTLSHQASDRLKH